MDDEGNTRPFIFFLNRTECVQLPTSFMGRPPTTYQYEDTPVQNSC